MPDLIDRDAVEDIITNALNGYLTDDVRNTLEGIGIAISNMSSVEVVRCKDCKWFNDIGCSIRIVDDSDKPTENDYCSFGERKDD